MSQSYFRSRRLAWLFAVSVIALLLPSRPASASQALLLADELPVCQADAVDFSGTEQSCNDLQVILLIDSSASMVGSNGNDVQGLRFLGATEAASILAEKYLEAIESGVRDLPELNIAAIHFGSAAPEQFFSGWIRIAPDSRAAWEENGKLAAAQALVPEGVDTYIPRVFPATNFILPFQAAADLAGQIEGPDSTGCPNRVVLVLTDGAPATGFVFTGQRLQDHMAQVGEIVNDHFSGPGDEVYVTAISSGEDYWSESRPLWEEITGESTSAAAEDAAARTARVPDAAALASRMTSIIATKVGLQIRTTELGMVYVPPFLDSVRITYFAPAALAELEASGPDDQLLTPDGENIVLTGNETATKVLEIRNPVSGDYTFTSSIPGGSLNVIYTYAETELNIENLTPELQQFTEGEVRFRVPDSMRETPQFRVTVTAPEQAAEILEVQQAGSEYSLDILPMHSGSGNVSVEAIGTDVNRAECLLGTEEFPFTVTAVTVTAEPAAEEICTPSGMPFSFPITVRNASSGDPADISLPLTWTVSSSHSENAPTSMEVEPAGDTGLYRFILDTPSAGTVDVEIQAAVITQDRLVSIYSEAFRIESLTQDRRYAFELTGVEDLADERTVRINRWLNRIPEATEDLLVLGSRRTGGPDSAALSITGRYFDQETGQEVAGIERFSLAIEDGEGSTVYGPSNAWELAEDGRQTLSLAAPPLGAYRIQIMDNGAPESCLTVTPPAGSGFILIGRERGPVLLAGTLVLLVISLLITGTRWLICVRSGPLTVNLKHDLELRVAPHEEGTLDLATLTNLVRLIVQEKAQPAVRKIRDREGWLHVAVQVKGYVEKPDVCNERERPMVRVPEGSRVPLHEHAEKASAVLLRLNRSAWVEVLDQLEGWYHVQVTFSGYIEAASTIQAEGRFRTCFRRPLTVRLQQEGSLRSTPLDIRGQDLLKLHQPAEMLVLEDEQGALEKVSGAAGWLNVQARLDGYVPAAAVEEGSATIVRAQSDRPLQVFEFKQEDGNLLADIFETAPAKVLEREGDWCRVEILAAGYVRANETGRPSKPFGSDRPDRLPIPDSRIRVPDCKDPEPDNLQIIEGIGPQVEKLLNAHGIWTFEDLVAYEGRTHVIEAWLDERGWEMMTPDTWPQQAALAAADNDAGLEALKHRLTAGRPEKD